MQEPDDSALLREYAERDSEAAFAALVERHVSKVYSVALRQTRNPHQAEEITQATFVILARKSRQLRKGVVISGWLCRTARFTAVTLLRSEIRRARRQQEACMQTAPTESESDAWPAIAPLLDAAMAGLNEKEHHAVVLRFFDGKSMRDVGEALGASEDAAKMRVNRALEKLRSFFNKRGIVIPGATLAAVIAANSVQAAPAMLSKSATAVALAGSAAAPTSTLTLVKGALKLMAWTKAQTAVVVGAVALLAVETTVVGFQQSGAAQPDLDSWRIPGMTFETVSKAAPQVRILPTKFSEPVRASLSAFPDKWAGLNVTVRDLLRIAYNWTPGRVWFRYGEPGERYDFAATLPRGNFEALQQEITKTLGLAAHAEMINTNVFVLAIKNPGAPGLVPHAGPRGRGTFDRRGNIYTMGYPLSVTPPNETFGLSKCLEMFVQIPVIDETGLKGNYDINISWDAQNDNNLARLKRVLLADLGLELAYTNRPVMMLVVDKVK